MVSTTLIESTKTMLVDLQVETNKHDIVIFDWKVLGRKRDHLFHLWWGHTKIAQEESQSTRESHFLCFSRHNFESVTRQDDIPIQVEHNLKDLVESVVIWKSFWKIVDRYPLRIEKLEPNEVDLWVSQKLVYLREKAGMTNPHKRRAKDCIAATNRPKRECKPPQRYSDDYYTSKWMHEHKCVCLLRRSLYEFTWWLCKNIFIRKHAQRHKNWGQTPKLRTDNRKEWDVLPRSSSQWHTVFLKNCIEY